MNEHDGRCPDCGAVVPCEESDCMETPGHEYTCEDCLRGERPARYADELPEADFYGYAE